MWQGSLPTVGQAGLQEDLDGSPARVLSTTGSGGTVGLRVMEVDSPELDF